MKIAKILNAVIGGIATVYNKIRHAPADHWTVYISSGGLFIYGLYKILTGNP